jgi:2-hydroxychromene-2-carboxylate isomerase
MTKAPPALDFWYEFASTYSYPAVERIGALADAAGVAVRWRPFLLGPIFQRQGWSDSPFNVYPAKGAYMWRDLERLCEAYGLPWRRPSRFPQNGLLASRIFLAGGDATWCVPFARAVFAANFARDQDIADATILGEILRGLDQDADAILARAQSPEVKLRLREETAEADRRGIFGAPSFTIGTELFWGHDRMEQAIEWAVGAATPRINPPHPQGAEREGPAQREGEVEAAVHRGTRP